MAAFPAGLYHATLILLMCSLFSALLSGGSMRAGEKLRLDVQSNQITPLIGVYDMFSATLVA